MPFKSGTILRILPVLVLFLTMLAASAQSGNAGAVRGTVTDPSSAVVPNATVTLDNARSGLLRTLQTDATGQFVFSNVPFNSYRIRISANGFTSLSRDFELRSVVGASLNLVLQVAGSTQTVTSSTIATADIAGNAVTSAKMAVANTYRVCDIPVNDTSGSAITNAQLGPQSRVCMIPASSAIVELDVNADAGTPNVIVGRNHAGTITNIVSSALATAGSGGIACSNTGGTTGLNGVTACSSTLQNTALNAGDYLELVSGTAGGTAKFFVAHVIYTVN